MNVTVFEVKPEEPEYSNEFIQTLAGVIHYRNGSQHGLSFGGPADGVEIQISGRLPAFIANEFPKVTMFDQSWVPGAVPWDMGNYAVWFLEAGDEWGAFASRSNKIGIASPHDLMELLCARSVYMKRNPLWKVGAPA